jgi:endonuclease/exonuclease/phosphatase family metal-dependent hydrolase
MSRVRLLTFNIAHARGLALHQGLGGAERYRRNLTRIAGLIRRIEADIVALQEVDTDSSWCGRFDHVAFLAAHTGLAHTAFGATNQRRAGGFHICYGNAVLSRFPLAHHEAHVFERALVAQKGFLFAEVELPEGRLPLVNMHLHHSSRPRRLAQVKRVAAYLAQLSARRGGRWCAQPVYCGDFNAPAHTPDATAVLLGQLEARENYTLLPKGRHNATFPSAWPQRALDHIFLPSACQQVEAMVVRSFLSDHRPVIAQFQL